MAITSARYVSKKAVLSCKEPLLVPHRHKVDLRPRPSFLPEVGLAFHLNQDNLLSSRSSSPEGDVHKCGPSCSFIFYYFLSSSFLSGRLALYLFVILNEPWKSTLTSCSTFSRWIHQIIVQMYGLKNSITAVTTCWATQHWVSLLQVYKVAT